MQLQGGITITGGTLSSTGTGAIQDNCCENFGTLLNGVTVDGTLQFNDGNVDAFLEGTITDNGSIQINCTGANTSLDITGAVTLNGTGTLTVSNSPYNYLFGDGQESGATLTNQITIEGAGNIGYGELGEGNSFLNNGTIYANQKNPLTIWVGSGSITNTGTLKVRKGVQCISLAGVSPISPAAV